MVLALSDWHQSLQEFGTCTRISSLTRDDVLSSWKYAEQDCRHTEIYTNLMNTMFTLATILCGQILRIISKGLLEYISSQIRYWNWYPSLKIILIIKNKFSLYQKTSIIKIVQNRTVSNGQISSFKKSNLMFSLLCAYSTNLRYVVPFAHVLFVSPYNPSVYMWAYPLHHLHISGDISTYYSLCGTLPRSL